MRDWLHHMADRHIYRWRLAVSDGTLLVPKREVNGLPAYTRMEGVKLNSNGYPYIKSHQPLETCIRPKWDCFFSAPRHVDALKTCLCLLSICVEARAKVRVRDIPSLTAAMSFCRHVFAT